SFGNQLVSTSSSPRTVTITNPSSSFPLGFSLSLAGTDFAIASSSLSCSTFLSVTTCTPAAGAPGPTDLTFTPGATGARSGTLSLGTPYGPLDVALGGAGTAVATPLASPSSLAFADQLVGTTSAPRTVTISNPDPVNPTGFSLSL